MISKDILKQEIERLDDACLERVFQLLQQFPHQQKNKPSIDLLSCLRPIHYPADENENTGGAFADVEDAASYGKQLRASA